MESYSKHPTMFKSNPLGFIGCILLIPVLGLGLFILLWWYMSARNTLFTVVDHEIRYETGILNKEHSEVSKSSIRSVRVKQTLLNRMMGVGTVEIYTAGDTPEIVAEGMPDPHKIRELTDQGAATGAQ